MTSIQLLGGLAFVIGVLGQVFLYYQMKEAFLVWLPSNAIIVYTSMLDLNYGVAALSVFNSVCCVITYRKWRQTDQNKDNKHAS